MSSPGGDIRVSPTPRGTFEFAGQGAEEWIETSETVNVGDFE